MEETALNPLIFPADIELDNVVKDKLGKTLPWPQREFKRLLEVTHIFVSISLYSTVASAMVKKQALAARVHSYAVVSYTAVAFAPPPHIHRLTYSPSKK